MCPQLQVTDTPRYSKRQKDPLASNSSNSSVSIDKPDATRLSPIRVLTTAKAVGDSASLKNNLRAMGKIEGGREGMKIIPISSGVEKWRRPVGLPLNLPRPMIGAEKSSNPGKTSKVEPKEGIEACQYRLKMRDCNCSAHDPIKTGFASSKSQDPAF